MCVCVCVGGCCVLVLVCTPDRVIIEGASRDGETVNEYQRSRQFTLRAVVLTPCGEESLLVDTTVKWTAQINDGGASVVRRAADTGSTITLPSNTKQLIVASNLLPYGLYAITTVIVSHSQVITSMFTSA